MSWYKKALALEPNMWATDPDPHRTREDTEIIWTPYGQVKQDVDTSEIASKYTGVHFTQSVEIAAVFANNKSTEDDPPAIITVDASGFERLPDVDAAIDTSIEDYIHDNWINEWSNIIMNESSSVEEKAEKLISLIQSDMDFAQEWGGDDNNSIVDYVENNFRGFPPEVIYSNLKNKTSEEIIASLTNWFHHGAPPELSIAIIQQFRVMKPVGSDRVVAIYKIERFSDTISNEFFDEEEYDEDGLRVIDRETLEYDWPKLETVYKNPNISRNYDPVYHGTSYNRAKQAFPDLLP